MENWLQTVEKQLQAPRLVRLFSGCEPLNTGSSQVGFESTFKRSFNEMQAGGWHLRRWKAMLIVQTERK